MKKISSECRKPSKAKWPRVRKASASLWRLFSSIRKGASIPVEIHGRVVFDQNDAPVLIQGVTRDISERKRAEEERDRLSAQLHQTQKLESIGTLAGGIAHDFNNILSAILGYGELASYDAESGTSLREYLDEIHNAGIRAKELVAQILTVARRSDETLQPTQPSVILKEVLKFIRSSIPATIEIRRHVKSDSVIMGNPSQVHQIFMNLCTNAGPCHGGCRRGFGGRSGGYPNR